jgi:hypothetical protein
VRGITSISRNLGYTENRAPVAEVVIETANGNSRVGGMKNIYELRVWMDVESINQVIGILVGFKAELEKMPGIEVKP